MSGPTILNASTIPLSQQQGTIPNMWEAITDWFQQMSFVQLTKTVIGFEALETSTITSFFGVIMPLKPRDLMLLPEGQRAWSWFQMFTQPQLMLQVDDVIVINGFNTKQTRVMSRENWSIYGHVRYTMIQDFTGSGPT